MGGWMGGWGFVGWLGFLFVYFYLFKKIIVLCCCCCYVCVACFSCCSSTFVLDSAMKRSQARYVRIVAAPDNYGLTEVGENGRSAAGP